MHHVVRTPLHCLEFRGTRKLLLNERLSAQNCFNKLFSHCLPRLAISSCHKYMYIVLLTSTAHAPWHKGEVSSLLLKIQIMSAGILIQEWLITKLNSHNTWLEPAARPKANASEQNSDHERTVSPKARDVCVLLRMRSFDTGHCCHTICKHFASNFQTKQLSGPISVPVSQPGCCRLCEHTINRVSRVETLVAQQCDVRISAIVFYGEVCGVVLQRNHSSEL